MFDDNQRIAGVGRDLKDHYGFNSPEGIGLDGDGQGQLSSDKVAQSPIHPGLESFPLYCQVLSTSVFSPFHW